MQEDTHHSIRDIRDRGDKCLVARLLEIQQYRREKEKSLQFAENLRVLESYSSRSDRRNSHGPNAARIFLRSQISNADYAAVSYPCNPSFYDYPTCSYYIKDEGSKQLTRSRVRDTVLNRVLIFLAHHNVTYFWIDQDCIDQDDDEERQVAMDSMDLVYKFSKFPVALLFVPIRTQREMDFLALLLQRKLICRLEKGRDIRLTEIVDETSSLEILTLLHRITSDQWWNRGWTFQEEYLAEQDMRLLIPHFRGLDKSRYKSVLGRFAAHDEIEVSSTTFRRQLTLFCIAYMSQGPELGWQVDSGCCREILARAGRYTSLAEYGYLIGYDSYGRAMSPTIFADIGARDISIKSDVLHIAANCCSYSLSMNTVGLTKDKRSLSLSVLAMFLINGELIWNSRRHDSKHMLSLNIWNYLRELSFNAFDPPVDHGGLSFIKRCRFVDPWLEESGIVTLGYLWQISARLDFGAQSINKRVKYRRGSGKASRDDDSATVSREFTVLNQLVQVISEDHPELTAKLSDFLENDFDPHTNRHKSPSAKMMTFTAIEIAQAIGEGKSIGIGHMESNSHPGDTPNLGLFVLDEDPSEAEPVYVFTAWQTGTQFNKRYKRQPDADKFVTLEVSVNENLPAAERGSNSPPHLITKGWIHGLYFFAGAPRQKFLFPWPRSLVH